MAKQEIPCTMYFIKCTSIMQTRIWEVEQVGVPGRVFLSGLEWPEQKKGEIAQGEENR